MYQNYFVILPCIRELQPGQGSTNINTETAHDTLTYETVHCTFRPDIVLCTKHMFSHSPGQADIVTTILSSTQVFSYKFCIDNIV